jgi:MFS family permease
MATPSDFTPAPKQPWPWPGMAPTRVRYGVLGFACALSLITYLDRVCIMRAKEDIQGDLGFGDREMGLIFSAFILGYALFEVPGGWMGDLWGSRRVLTRIVLCWSAFTALTGCVWAFTLDSGLRLSVGEHHVPLLLNALVVLLLVRFLFGAGEAGAYPNLTRVTRDWFPFQERAAAQGAIWMSARLGGALAPFVLGRLSALLGWRQAFWVLGLVGVGWAVLFVRWFRDRPEDKPECNQAERDLIRGGPEADTETGSEASSVSLSPCLLVSVSASWPGAGALLSSVTMWALCCTAVCVCFGWYFYPTWQPKYLKDVHGFRYDSQSSELLSGLPFLFGAAGSLAGGRLSDWLVRRTGNRRWGRSLIGCGGFLGAGLCVLATGFAASAWQAVALLCLAFLINDLAIPVIWAASADVGGRYAGTVAGLMNTAGAVGAILSPALIPHVLELLPADYGAAGRWRVIFAGLACSWFLGAAAWLFIDASKPLVVRGP